MRRIGIGYRHPLAAWIDRGPLEVGCLEITAEHFFEGGEDRLRSLSERYPLFVHGLGLSLGTPGPLDAGTLRRFAEISRIANPMWISEHVAFTRTAEVDLGHLNPIRPSRESLAVFVDHARELAETCRKPLIVENITSHLRLEGEFSETEFLNRLCELANCGLLLDVTNLFINAKNHGFDPRKWLRDIEPRRIVQLHVVGYSQNEGRYEDHHGAAIQDDLLELVSDVLDYAPVQAVILERDLNLENVDAIVAELRRLEAAGARA